MLEAELSHSSWIPLMCNAYTLAESCKAEFSVAMEWPKDGHMSSVFLMVEPSKIIFFI